MFKCRHPLVHNLPSMSSLFFKNAINSDWMELITPKADQKFIEMILERCNLLSE